MKKKFGDLTFKSALVFLEELFQFFMSVLI